MLRSYVANPLQESLKSHNDTLRTRITALEDQLAHMKTTLVENAHTLSLIRALPAELHLYIFELSGAFDDRSTAISIASVCFHWRSVALSSPQISHLINTGHSLPIPEPRLKEPMPFILGFALTYQQLYAVACAELTEQSVNGESYGGDPLLALRGECLLKNKEYDIIAFPKGPLDNFEARYLYIVEVVPSWTGRNPTGLTLTRETGVQFFNEHGRQPLLRKLEVFSLPWPAFEPEPWWLKKRLWHNIGKIQEDHKARLALKNSEGTCSVPSSSSSSSQPTL